MDLKCKNWEDIQSRDSYAGKKVLEDIECCLYKVDESMKKMLTSYVDSNRSMNRAHGSNNISMVNRDRKSEMQANVLLVNFPCDQKIPQQCRQVVVKRCHQPQRFQF